MITQETYSQSFLQLLAQQYPSIQAASMAIINLSANLDLPKGTEHFISDVHGEYEAFSHVLKNGSGSIRRKIEEIFSNSLLDDEKRNLATLIYYPEQKLPLILKNVENDAEWYRITLFRLIKLCREVSSKYTRTAVREALPDDFAFIIEELLHEQESVANKQEYYQSIIETIISTNRGDAFVVAMAELIQRLAIARLHVIGDVYDRGPGAHIIMDKLLDYHAVDVQWGNHDILWMGAAAGSEACIANVIRICLRYGNMETLENGYAVSMLPLASFAMETYADDPCERFKPKVSTDEFTQSEIQLMSKMQKAITIIQFKLEAQIIQRRKHYGMADRLLLDKIDFDNGTICLNGQDHSLLDTHLPTVDPDDPFRLSEKEKSVLERLRISFANSERLQKHVRFLYAKGGLYLIYNGNLLYHGCIAMNEDGSFATVRVDGETFEAKSFMDRLDRLARQGYVASDPEQKLYGQDVMWYLWSGAHSPLFGKKKMATFERYFLADSATHQEGKNAYYALRDKPETAVKILEAFGLDPNTARIVNGHVPVEVKKGESPVKANGRLIVIDGGFSKAYQDKTGIAGYTLIHNSYGFLLASHAPFESTQKAIEEGLDIHSKTEILEANFTRIRVRDTDEGRQIQAKIHQLQALLAAYREGEIKEQ
ncbi:fructose-1,6-bisphosphatase [Candidatus Leptofilum sp.]|uniref:fructose-1,6-bisphosphatase n=1 Tax=Candidatus Leptofilum sp. TaxID=3241576 RepID=UPI003B5A3893